MADPIEEARALLAEEQVSLRPIDPNMPQLVAYAAWAHKMMRDAPRLLAALADECERLRAHAEKVPS